MGEILCNDGDVRSLPLSKVVMTVTTTSKIFLKDFLNIFYSHNHFFSGSDSSPTSSVSEEVTTTTVTATVGKHLIASLPPVTASSQTIWTMPLFETNFLSCTVAR